MNDQLQLWPGPVAKRRGERLRWSVTRAKRLDVCARRYYFFHYGSRGGRRAAHGTRARELYVLKSLRNRHMWVGEVVHELVEQALRAWLDKRKVAAQQLIDQGVEMMRARFRESAQGLYRRQPDTACGLVEHEYEEGLSRDEWQAQRERMERCVRHFCDLEIVEGFRALPRSRWLALETMGTFELDGATVIAKPDFVCKPGRQRVCIVDWKTGQPRPEDELFQLAVYGLYGRDVWATSAETLEGHAAYLESANSAQFELTSAELERAEGRVRASVATMRELDDLVQRDGEAAEQHFPATRDRAECQRCNFRRICGLS